MRAREKSPDPACRNLKWGLVNENWSIPHVKPLQSFLVLEHDLFASSDGTKFSLWKRNEILRNIDLEVLSMVYFPKLNQIAAYVKGSNHLHFIYLYHPYTVREHPLHFTNRHISTMVFYERTSTLVCAGQGLSFTRVVIPPYFKNAEPVPETLQFEKIAVYYENVRFDGTNAPTMIQNSGTVMVCIDQVVYIHMPNGLLVQKLKCEGCGLIGSISYSEIGNCLVIGDKDGFINMVDFKTPNPFVPGAAPESGVITRRFKISTSKIIVGEIFDRNFMIAGDDIQNMFVYSLRDNVLVVTSKCPMKAFRGQMMKEYLVMFTPGSVVGYSCAIYTQHWKELACDATELRRCVSSSKAARIQAWLANHSVDIYSPLTGQQIFGLMSANITHDMLTFGYVRDVLNDGSKYNLIQSEDLGFAVLDQGYLAFVNFDHVDKTCRVPSDAFVSTMQGFDTAWLQTDIMRMNVLARFVSAFRIESREYTECICTVQQNGMCHIFSIADKCPRGSFISGCANVICAIYSFSNKYLIISSIGKLTTFDIQTKRIVLEQEGCMYTSLLLLDEDTLVCGGANGAVEVRSVRTFKMTGNSMLHNASHSDRGHKFPLENMYSDTRLLYDIPFAVKHMDYCECREAILSLSVSGEIFIWNRSAVPLLRIETPFNLTSACFLNGNGTILVSAFRTLFQIDSKLVFEKPFLPVSTLFDDFDLRTESGMAEERVEITRVRPATIRVAKRSQSVLERSESDDEEQEYVSNYTDLIVELPSLSKRFMAPPRAEDVEEEEYVVKKVQDMDEMIRKEADEEAKKNSKVEVKKRGSVKARKKQERETLTGPVETSRSVQKPTKSIKMWEDDYKEPRRTVKRAKKAKKKKEKEEAKPIDSFPVPQLLDRPSVQTVPQIPSPDPILSSKDLKAVTLPTVPIEPPKKETIKLPETTPQVLETPEPKQAESFFERMNRRAPRRISNSENVLVKPPPRENRHSASSTKSEVTVSVTNFNFGDEINQTKPPEPVRSQTYHPVREPEPVVTAQSDDLFNTQCTTQIVTPREVPREPEAVNSSQKRKPKPQTVRFARIEREVTHDDSMFTSYKIDGFRQPFGGFVLAKADQPVLAKSINAPVMRLATMPKVQTNNAKTNTKPVLVKPPSYAMSYQHTLRVNNTNVS